MKIIQTFWTGPYTNNDKDILHMQAGWLSAEYHWMSWALSCLQLKNVYGQAELVTDALGREVLIDRLKLPYTNVSTALEGRLDGYPPVLWSLAKISTFAAQEEPFLHFDGDVFVWQQFEDRILQAPLLAQNIEVNLSFYRNMLDDITEKLPLIPALLQKAAAATDIYAVNTGVFGGHDLRFIKDYCRQAWQFVDDNKDSLHQLIRPDQLNFIFEQCLLYYLAEQQGVQPVCIVEDLIDDPAYMDFARFADVPDVPLIHTVAGYKKMAFTCEHMARRLRNDYPDVYYAVVELCKNYQVPVHSKVYEQGVYHQCFDEAVEPINQQLQLGASYQAEAFKEKFTRSIAALQYALPDKFVLPASGQCTALLLEEQAAVVTNAQWQQKITELIALENTGAAMMNRLADKAFVRQLYCHQRKTYHQADLLYRSSTNALMEAMVVADEQVCLLEMSDAWNDGNVEVLRTFVEEVLNKEAEPVQIALVFNLSLMAVQELCLDSIETVVLQACTEKCSVGAVLKEIEQCFPPEELEQNYAAYQKLVLDTIRQLVHAGVLWIT